MHSTFKIASAAIVLAGLALTSQPAAANSSDFAATRSTRIEYRPSQIVDEAGARRLFQRLERAAGKVCTLPGAEGRRGRGYKDCRDSALADAVKAIDAPMLSAMLKSGAAPVVLATR